MLRNLARHIATVLRSMIAVSKAHLRKPYNIAKTAMQTNMVAMFTYNIVGVAGSAQPALWC